MHVVDRWPRHEERRCPRESDLRSNRRVRAMIRQRKIAIVGAGLVGGSAALFSAYAVPGVEIVVIDFEPVRAEGQVVD
jgi:tRNA A37 threonylcarbamoyladenosine dehydratase